MIHGRQFLCFLEQQLDEFYLLQKLKRKFWKIVDTFLRISWMTHSFTFTPCVLTLQTYQLSHIRYPTWVKIRRDPFDRFLSSIRWTLFVCWLFPTHFLLPFVVKVYLSSFHGPVTVCRSPRPPTNNLPRPLVPCPPSMMHDPETHQTILQIDLVYVDVHSWNTHDLILKRSSDVPNPFSWSVSRNCDNVDWNPAAKRELWWDMCSTPDQPRKHFADSGPQLILSLWSCKNKSPTNSLCNLQDVLATGDIKSVKSKHPHLNIRGYGPLLLLLSLISYSKLVSWHFPRDS
jgi:hypothetical protein